MLRGASPSAAFGKLDNGSGWTSVGKLIEADDIVQHRRNGTGVQTIPPCTGE